MRISSFFYSLKESFKNLWRNRLMSFASITSVTATLLILGIVFVVILNINSLAQSAKDQIDSIQVFVSDEATSAELQILAGDIFGVEGVKEVVFETREEALNKMKEQWGENGDLLDGMEFNPLPNSFIVYLDDIGFTNYVVGEIQAMEHIEEVKFYQDIVEKILAVTEYVRTIGIVIITLLIAISTFIIHNTIKLAVNSRRIEINIMKYVGATHWFVRWPFLLEGTILGMIGAMLATGLVYMAYQYTYTLITSEFYVIIAAYIIRVDAIIYDLLILFMIIGAGIGALGSIWSMRRYLNV